jgi:hypothetical protein
MDTLRQALKPVQFARVVIARAVQGGMLRSRLCGVNGEEKIRWDATPERNVVVIMDGE